MRSGATYNRRASADDTDVCNPSNPAEEGLSRDRPPLRAFGHAPSGPILFGGIAIAAYDDEFARGLAPVLCGSAAMIFTRLYVNFIWSARLSRRPEPAHIPLWAVVIYAAVGLALLFLIMCKGGSYSFAAIEFLVGWAAGCNRLNYLWTRRAKPETPEASDVIYNWLAERAAPHRLLLTRLGYAASFALLFGGVALHAYTYGFSLAGVAQCGSACAGPGFLAFSAVLCGVGAVLLVMVYATIAEATQFVLIDSWKHVRPGPPPPEMPVWVVALHILVGLVVFFAIGAFVEISPAMETPGNTWMSVDLPGGKEVTLSGSAMFRMTFGWRIGGAGVLKFFWLRRRAGGVNEIAPGVRRDEHAEAASRRPPSRPHRCRGPGTRSSRYPNRSW